MNEKKPYKSDRRTRYTRQVIKETFLAMLQECSFEKGNGDSLMPQGRYDAGYVLPALPGCICRTG